jgi:hypothetical protein
MSRSDQNQAGVRGDARSLKRDLQKPIEHELERLGCFLTHRVAAQLLTKLNVRAA